jgi:hypothetical protein
LSQSASMGVGLGSSRMRPTSRDSYCESSASRAGRPIRAAVAHDKYRNRARTHPPGYATSQAMEESRERITERHTPHRSLQWDHPARGARISTDSPARFCASSPALRSAVKASSPSSSHGGGATCAPRRQWA